jgi:osomolarity two-component system sensor histidine kinase SLN1
VELVLSKHNRHSSVPTRTIGDPSTGTQYSSPQSDEESSQKPVLQEEPTSKAVRQHTERPTYVPLPSPRSFSLDPQATSTSARSNNSALLSPLATLDWNNARGNTSSSSPPAVFEPELCVLVVDDDQVTRTLMKRILTRLGCHVTTAENGEVALDLILGSNGWTPSTEGSGNVGPILEQECPNSTEEGRFAVIFLDNQMPVLSGLKAVAKLRSLGRKDFVVGVTGEIV